MDKRYQIFISSTFVDLRDERQAVLKAILELDHMPAGMELFPATDESAWQLIQDVIDNSDYYVLIVGGRYGSVDEAGIGFTEREYLYALEKKKPVIALLHENPDGLPREKTETSEATWNKLKSFRAVVEKRHTCVYWRNADDLKAKVIVGLTATVKRIPAVGWVRADEIPSDATLAEILKLKKQVAELQAESEASADRPPVGSEKLAQGADVYDIDFSFKSFDSQKQQRLVWSYNLSLPWEDIFYQIGPILLDEASDDELLERCHELVRDWSEEERKDDKRLSGHHLSEFKISDHDFQTIKIQLRALGLMAKSQKPRSLKDQGTYWALTPYGDKILTSLRAISKEEKTVDGASGLDVI